MKPNAFECILASLHEAALDDARWPSAAARIDEALGTHGNTLASGDGDSERNYRFYFMWTCLRGERRRDLENLWFETYYSLDEGTPRVRRLPYNRLFHVTSLYTDEEMKTSAAYNMLRTLAHAGNGINVRLDGPGGSRILWQVNDPVDGEGWSSVQRDMIQRLLPHIRQTVHVRQALSGANALGSTMTQLLDTTDLGIVQLDARGQIVEVNDRARSLLRGNDGLSDKGGFLFAHTRPDNVCLQNLVGRALPPFGIEVAGGSTMVERPGELPPLVLHVIPVGRREANYPAWPVAALVLVVDPVSGSDLDDGVVAATLGLTRMESRVAVLLTHGMSVKQIAAATGRKESTIRSHVKNMFAKHGLSRQGELVRLVQSLAGAPQARI